MIRHHVIEISNRLVQVQPKDESERLRVRHGCTG
jgi:hypothetical protein